MAASPLPTGEQPAASLAALPAYDADPLTGEAKRSNGRIVGAGCMLPLSGNTNLSRDLGMRHRAGIGISENSDAVVVIVSEETGSISVAIGGMLKRHLMPETLRQLLRNELMPQPEEEPDKPRLSLRELLHAHRKGEQNGNQD